MASKEKTSEYLQTLNRMRSNYQTTGNVLVNPMDDSTKVGTDISSFAYMNTPMPQPINQNKNVNTNINEKPSNDSSFYTKFVATGDEIISYVRTGLLEVVDGVFDLLMYASGGVGKLFGGSDDWVKNITEYDWVSPTELALENAQKTLRIENLFVDEMKQDTIKGWNALRESGASLEELQRYYNKSFSSLLGESGQQTYQQLLQGIGGVLPSIAIGGLAAAGKISTGAAQAISLVTMGASSFGSGVESAFQEGATYGQAGASGAISTAIELGSEFIPIPGLNNRVGNIGSKITNKTIKEIGKAMLEEGSEEVISEFLSPIAKLPYKGAEALKEYGSADLYKNTLTAFVGGAIGGALGGGVQSNVLKNKYSPEGVETLYIATETAELQQQGIEEYQRGDKANQTKLNKIRNKIESNLKTLKEKFKYMQDQDNANGTNYYEELVNTLGNPSLLMKELGTSIEEVENQNIRKGLKKISLGRNVNIDILEDSEYDEVVDPSGVGTRGFFTTKITNEQGQTINSIVIRKSKLNEFYQLVAHEGISHGVLDMNQKEKNDLIEYIKNDKKLSKDYEQALKEVQELYAGENEATIESETLARFLEKYITNSKDLQRITDHKAKKGIRKLLNSLKDFVVNNNIDKKNRLIKRINQAIENINKENVVEETTETETENVSFARDTSSQVDSEGNTLTPEQVEFFADSQVRDENGNLLVVYHGSRNIGFTEFDINRYGESGRPEKAFFFVNQERVASNFANQGEVRAFYLNMIKPLNLDNLSENDINNLVEMGAKNFGLSKEEIEKQIKQYMKAKNYYALKMYINYDMVSQYGYDGIVVTWNQKNESIEYAVFNANQIKLISNENPTELSDIRYARGGTEQEVRETTHPRSSLVTSRAKLFSDKFLKIKTANDIVNLLLEEFNDSISSEGGELVLNENAKPNDLFEEFNLNVGNTKEAKEKLKARISKYVDYLFSSQIKSNGKVILTLEELIKKTLPSDVTFEQYKEEYVDSLLGVLYESSTESRTAKLKQYYNEKIEKLKVKLYQYQFLRTNIVKTYISIQKLTENLKKPGLSLTIKSNPKVSTVISLYNKLLKNINVTETNKGFSPKGVEKILNSFGDFDMNILNDENIQSLLDTSQEVIDEFKNCLEILKKNAQIIDGKYKFKNGYQLTFEQTDALSKVVSIIKKDIKQLIKAENANLTEINAQSDTEILNVYNMRMALPEGKRKLSISENIGLTFASIDTNIGSYYGFDSDFYKIFYKDIVDSYNMKLMQEYNYLEKLENLKNKYNLKSKDLNKKVKFEYNGKKITTTYGDLLDIYIESLSDYGLENLSKGGYELINVKGEPITLILDEMQIENISKLLTDNMKNFGQEVLESLYNGELKKYKADKDLEIFGYERVISKKYYPKNKSQTSKLGADTIDIISLDTSLGQNIRESRNMTHLAIKGMSFESRFRAYVDGVTRYGEMYMSTKRLANLVNGYTIDNNGKSVKRMDLIQKAFPGLEKYLDIYEQMITGQSNERVKGKSSQFAQNLVSSTLFGNASVILKQPGSLPTILNEVSPSAFIKGIKGFKNTFKREKMKTFLKSQSGFLNARFTNKDTIKAETLTTNLNAIAKVFGIPMEEVDSWGIYTFGYSVALAEAEIRFPNATETEIQNEAIKILNDIVLNTQSNAIPFKMSPARAGRSLIAPSLVRLASVFSADANNKLNYIVKETKGVRQAKRRVKFTESQIPILEQQIEEIETQIEELGGENLVVEEGEENPVTELVEKKESLKEKIKRLEKILKSDRTFISGSPRRALKLIVSLFMSALYIAAIAQLIKRILGKTGWAWDSKTTKELITTTVIDTTIGNIPFVTQILNAIEYDTELSAFDYQGINSIVELLKGVIKSFEDGKFNTSGLATRIMEIIGYGTGIPVKNLYNLIMGIFKNISPEGYKIDNLIKGYSENYVYTQYKEALEEKHYNRAKGNLELLLYEYKGGNVSDQALEEMFSLAKKGYNVTPTTNLSEITNEKGEVEVLTSKQQKEFLSAYNVASMKVDELINITEYRNLSDEDKAKAIRRLYSAYYNYGKAKVTGQPTTNKLANLLLASDGNFDLVKYLATIQMIGGIEKTEQESRKNLVMKKLNSLNLSKNEKLLVLYLSGFSLSESNKQMLQVFLNTKGVKANSLAF